MANPFAKIRLFYQETAAELKKSSWPDRKEIRSSMLVVFAALGLMGVFVGLADFSIYNVMDLLRVVISGK